MNKIKKKDNPLIKRKNLILVLKKAGISRVNKKAIEEIENKIKAYLTNLALSLKQAITIKGKKTLEKQDILALENKDESFWEV